MERYFSNIGKSKPEEVTEIFKEVVRGCRNLMIGGEDIVDTSIKSEYGRDGEVTVAEMKGVGLISSIVSCGGFGRARVPLYEINSKLYTFRSHRQTCPH